MPANWLRPSSPLKDADVEDVGAKRKLKRGERGPGKKDYASSRALNQSVKQIFDKLHKFLGEETVDFSKSNKAQTIEGVINKLKNCYQIVDCRKVNNETNLSIVNSLRKYFTGLREYGGKFTLVGSTFESVLTAVLDVNSNNVEIAKLLNVSTRRIVSGKVKRELFNGIVEKEENKKELIILWKSCSHQMNRVLMNFPRTWRNTIQIS